MPLLDVSIAIHFDAFRRFSTCFSSLVPAAILLLLLGGAFLLGSRSCDRELERLRKQNASFRSRLVQASSTLPPPPSTTCPTPPTPAPRTLCEIIKDHAWAGPLPVPAVRRADSPYDLTYLNGTESGVKKGLHVPRVMWQDDLYMRNQTYAHELYVAVASVACKWHGLSGKEGAAGE